MAIGSMDIDLSDRETYTSDSYSYTIEYPTGWSVTETDPTSVSFIAPSSPASLGVFVSEDAPSSATLDKATAMFLRGYKQSAAQDNGQVETLNRQQVTLSNGNRAVVLEIQATVASGVSVRQNLIITLVNNTLYAAAMTIPESAYTSTVDQETTEILTSLTISGGSTTA
jgi:hypothetical protein